MKTVTIILVLFYLFGASSLLAEEPSSVFLSAEMFAPLSRAIVSFDHDEHNETHGLSDCSMCHHLYENGQVVDGESSEDRPCSECHSLKKSPENSVPLRKAFHFQCKACHDQEGKGPRLCGECHRK